MENQPLEPLVPLYNFHWVGRFQVYRLTPDPRTAQHYTTHLYTSASGWRQLAVSFNIARQPDGVITGEADGYSFCVTMGCTLTVTHEDARASRNEQLVIDWITTRIVNCFLAVPLITIE